MEKENHLFKCPVLFKIPNLLWEEHSGHSPVRHFSVSVLREQGEPCWIKVLAFLSSRSFLSPAGLQTRTDTPTLQEFPILAFIPETTPPGYKCSQFCCQGRSTGTTPRGRSCIRGAPGSSQELTKGLLINTPTCFAQLTPVRKPFTHCLQLWSLWAERLKNPFALINTSHTNAIYFLYVCTTQKAQLKKKKN